MAQTIKLKRTAVPGKIPSTSQLELGEVGINTYDGKIFIKKNNGTESIIEFTNSSNQNIDAGRADSIYGGTITIDCGGA